VATAEQPSRSDAVSFPNPFSGLTPTTPRRSSGEIVASFVRRLIYSGRLRPGDRVSQREVARLLSLSKIPVREGLIAVEREGLVTFGADRGAIVNRLEPGMIQDGFDIFGAVYSYAVRCAYGRGGEAFVARAVGLCDAIAAASEPDELQRLVGAFHSAVLMAAGSPRITTVLGATARVEIADLFREIPAVAVLEVRGVATIARALRRDSPAKAAISYRRLLRREGQVVVAELRRRGLFNAVG
jgi:DNA-binding GntR family transcriptional regulator